MIRRVVEYVIVCDAPKQNDCWESTAFGSSSADDCAEMAKKHDWRQVSARLWLCPDCAKKAKHDEQDDGESVE